MSTPAKAFDQLVRERRAVRVYEQDQPIAEGVVQRSLERAVLAPNSSNLQTWGFYHIQSTEMKQKIARLCMNQSAARTAQELVVVACRSDKWKSNSERILAHISQSFSEPPTKRDKRAIEYYRRNIPLLYTNDPLGIMSVIRRILVFFMAWSKPFPRWYGKAYSRIIAHKSAALAAQTFMLSMQAEGYDTCPMEGFDEKRVKKLLQLPRKAEISMIIATGIGAEGGVYSERFRFPNEEIIFKV
ncbi:MAG: nitroreductase family protein [Bacteroidota bacterium]